MKLQSGKLNFFPAAEHCGTTRDNPQFFGEEIVHGVRCAIHRLGHCFNFLFPVPAVRLDPNLFQLSAKSELKGLSRA